MLRFVSPTAWSPVGVDDLEPAAMRVVYSASNECVVAGPGAGKTELLAQRACYLLQTGLCPPPRRILAISFKRDAAKNLEARVHERCGPEMAVRFRSLTFDSFSKSLLDRFMNALPPHWRPSARYDILLSDYRTFRSFLNGLESPPNWIIEGRGDLPDAASFQKECVLGEPLMAGELEATDFASWAAGLWWDKCLRAEAQSQLTFPMIGRLAELLLRTSPLICTALRATYSHVFMDEFQDTTHVQYDLVKTAFHRSTTILTAVGDHRQQIMRWAMALDDPFSMFEGDFGVRRVTLVRNYRSSPELVRMQHQLALIIDPNSRRASAMRDQDVESHVCRILDFTTPQTEAEYLADLISADAEEADLSPRDFAFLVKQKPQDYAPLLCASLGRRQLKARVETELQDTLAERVTAIVVALLRLGATERGGSLWSDCCRIVAGLQGADPDDYTCARRSQNTLAAFHLAMRTRMSRLPRSESQTGRLVEDVVQFLGRDRIKLLYPEYRRGDWLDSVTRRIAKYLTQSCACATTWDAALDDFEGRDSIPIMTIHKSKGLEYHTVVFVGLDDRAWWSFARQPEESRSAFFVAFSRARERILFTYCPRRGGRTQIASLYDVLRRAGVQTENVG